jgi:lysozyme family protein
MTINFQPALDFVLRHECAFAPGHDGDLNCVVTENVRGDDGGPTKFGIDATDHPGIDIANLSLTNASDIYRAGEWANCRCDDLPAKIDAAVFDCAVNNGVATGGILLQRTLLRCGFVLPVDGEIGDKTVRAALAEASLHAEDLLTSYLDLRREHYANIALHRPADARFLKGWLNRVNDLEDFLTTKPCLRTGASSGGNT